MWRSLLGVVVIFFALAGTVQAQAGDAPDLTVTLLDVDGVGVAQVQLIVRDSSGQRDLARAVTNTAGVAIFPTVTESVVRVAVIGSLPSGQVLVQSGDAARGIRITLDPAATTLQLRVDLDGSILPDPATEIIQDSVAPLNAPSVAPDEAGVLVATSGAVATPDVVPTPRRSPTAPRPVQATADTSVPLWALALIALFGLMIFGVVVLRRQL